MKESQLKDNLAAPATIIAILGALAALTVMSWGARVRLPISADYGPFQKSLYTVRLAAGEPFYRDFRQPPWLPVIYGPIAPWLASHLARAFGTGVEAAMAAGRVISIVAALAVSLMIFALARLHKASAAAAIIVALAFMLSPLTRFQGAEYRVDLLALAFNLGGMLLFEAGFGLAAVPLFVAAFFTKQGQFYGLAAVLLTLGAEREFRRALAVGAAWLLLTGSVLTTLAIVFPWYWLNSFTGLAPLLDLTAPFSFIGQDIFEHAALFLLAAIALRRVRWDLTAWLFLAALLENSISALRWGSAPYYFLPSIAAAAILGSASLDWIFAWAAELSRPARVSFGLFAALVLCSGLCDRAVHTTMKMDFALVPIRRTSVPLSSSTLNTLLAMDGPIVSTLPEYMVSDQRPNVYWMEVPELNAMKARGSFDDRPLLNSIRSHEIAAFVLDPAGLDVAYRGRRYYWPQLSAAIQDNYIRLPGTGSAVVMVANRIPAVASSSGSASTWAADDRH